MNLNAAYKEARMSAEEGTIISDRTYNLSIGIVILWGLLINYVIYRLFASSIPQMHYALMIVIYLAGSLGGMMIVYKSENAIISFLGFTILAAAMGVILTYLLSFYNIDSILTAIRITGVTTCVMIVLAMIKPDFFMKLGRTLLIALLICLVIQIVCSFIFRMRMGILDWGVALIFCGYIGYDWSKAQLYPKTLDNAVDSAADIYVDIVNLLIRVLAIAGKGKSND